MLTFIRLPKYTYVRFISDYINIDEVILRLDKKDNLDMIQYFFNLVDFIDKEKVEQQAMVIRDVFLNIENHESNYDMWYIISSGEIFLTDRVNTDVVIIPFEIKCPKCNDEEDDDKNDDKFVVKKKNFLMRKAKPDEKTDDKVDEKTDDKVDEKTDDKVDENKDVIVSTSDENVVKPKRKYNKKVKSELENIEDKPKRKYTKKNK